MRWDPLDQKSAVSGGGPVVLDTSVGQEVWWWWPLSVDRRWMMVICERPSGEVVTRLERTQWLRVIDAARWNP